MLYKPTKEEIKIINSGSLSDRIIYDAKFFLESLVSITDKDRQIIPFIFNPSQNRYYKERTLRDIILKPRQLGFSTEIIGLFLHDTMFVPNTVSVIVAHTTEDAADLFKRAKFMFDSVPEVFRPQVRLNNQKQLYFDKINSVFFIGSAEAKDFGRSKTIQNLHLSEASSSAFKDDFFVGLLESVPSTGWVVIESTARGEGGPFYDYYMKAKEKQNEYRTHYYRWFEHLEYRTPLLDGEKMNLTEDEVEISRKIKSDRKYRLLRPEGLDEQEKTTLVLEQVKWRREKKNRLGKKFIQEYPELDDDDAFLKSGSPVFDTDILKAVDKTLAEQNPVEIWLGGDLYIYKIAEPGARYIVGSDTSEGDINSDYSAAMVIRAFPFPIEQVALLHGRWSPDILSEKLYKIGMAYNKASIAVERNNHGHAVILNLANGIVRQGIVKYPPYPDIFVGPDKKYGWLTSGTSKPQMIEELDRVIRSGELVMNSKQFLSEARKFNYLAASKMGAPSGAHDDIVMAMAIALMGVIMGRFDFSYE